MNLNKIRWIGMFALVLMILGILAFEPADKIFRDNSVQAAVNDSFALQAQAPGWSRGQQNLVCSVEENCNIGAMLNATWTENENGWTGTWSPKGKLVKTGDHTYSKVYSATWTRSKPKGHENDDIPTTWYAEHFKITITGNHVTIGRKDPPMVGKYPAGAGCTYDGTIEENRVKNGGGDCGNWTATIECD